MSERCELYAAVLEVRPSAPGVLLPGSGRAVQGWWLDYLRGVDPELAQRLHDGQERRPYTCSGVEGVPTDRPGTRVPVSPERTYRIRLTAWAGAVVERLQQLVAQPPESLRLGELTFLVSAAAPDAATPPTTFANLATRALLPPGQLTDALPDVTLRFLTATTFRQSAVEHGPRPPALPFPLPGPVWGGLLERWHQAAPIQLDPGLRETMPTRVGVSRFAGESQRVLVSGIGDGQRQVGATGGQWLVGYIGRCTYWWPKRDTYLGSVLHLLASFAEYAGVGYGTTYGLGQVRVSRES